MGKFQYFRVTKKFVFLLVLWLGGLPHLHAQALQKQIVIGIADGGLDTTDPRLAGRLLTGEDSGWNVIKQNQILFTPRNDTPEDIERYQKIYPLTDALAYRKLSPQEEADFKELRQQVNLSEMNKYYSHMHAQHVAGIILNQTKVAKLIPMTLVADHSDMKNGENFPTEGVSTSSARVYAVDPMFLERLPSKYFGLSEIRNPMYTISRKYLVHLNRLFEYITERDMNVINLSIESSVRDHLARTILNAWDYHFRTTPSEEVVTQYVQEAQRYMSSFVYQGVVNNPDKLFVFGAGNWTDAVHNQGNNSDTDPVFPTSVVAFYNPDNVLVVAATHGRESLATFSAYGEKTVHVAAPGVDVESFSLGGGTYRATGTSQAAPYVTNTAARMLEVFPHLTTLQLKKIIMATVDKKDFLKNKVISGGIANPNRAVFVAEKMRDSMSLEQAIALSLTQVRDL